MNKKNKMMLFIILFVISLLTYIPNIKSINTYDILSSTELKTNMNIQSSTILEPLIVNPSVKNDMGLNDFIINGYRGNGVNVAIVDSGINTDYFDNIEFYGIINGSDTNDYIGHGTNVASLISGNNFGEGYYGISNETNLYIFKVFDDENGESNSQIVSDVLDYIIEYNSNSSNDPIDIINLSLGSEVPDKAIDNKIKEVWNSGIIVVSSAGNEGYILENSELYYPIYNTINSPGSALEGITVGALSKDNNVAIFSSNGPTSESLFKPDLIAPGHNITLLDSDGSSIQDSGTSFSAPIVSAGIACVLSKLYENGYSKPSLTDIKMALLESTTTLTNISWYLQGNGIPNFQLMYDNLIDYIENDEIHATIYPQFLNYPNEFNYYYDVSSLSEAYYIPFEFKGFSTTLLVRTPLEENINIIMQDSIKRFFIINYDTSIFDEGQYIINIKLIQPIFTFPGIHEGRLLVYGKVNGENQLLDYIDIKVTISLYDFYRIIVLNDFLSFGVGAFVILVCSLGVISKKISKNKINKIESIDPNKPLKFCPHGYVCKYNPKTNLFDILEKIEDV